MMFFCQHVCLNKVLRHFNGRITLKKAHHRMIQEYKQEKKTRSKIRKTMSYYKAGSFFRNAT